MATKSPKRLQYYLTADKLIKKAEEVEKRLPMMSFKTEDDFKQMQKYVTTYYWPILHEFDKVKLDREYLR